MREEGRKCDGRVRVVRAEVRRVKASGAKFLVAPPVTLRLKPREGVTFCERLPAAGVRWPRPAGLPRLRPAADLPPRPRPPPERPFRANAGSRKALNTSATASTKTMYFFVAILGLDFCGYRLLYSIYRLCATINRYVELFVLCERRYSRAVLVKIGKQSGGRMGLGLIERCICRLAIVGEIFYSL